MDIKELENYITKQQSKIDEKTSRIKEELDELLMLIFEMSMLFVTHKETTKSNTSRMLAASMDITPGEVNNLVKTYKMLNKRNSVDRVFLENLNILETPQRANRVKKRKKSNMVQVGSSLASIRNLSEKRVLSANEKKMIKDMLIQLERDI